MLAGDNFIPGFIYSACGPFKKKERIQKFKETWDSKYIDQNELDKAWLQSYGNFKDLLRTTASDEVLRDEASNIAKNQNFSLFKKTASCSLRL